MKYLFIILLFFSCSLSDAQIAPDRIEKIESVEETTQDGTYKFVSYQAFGEVLERFEAVEFHSLAEEDSLGLISLYEFGQPITSCDCNFQNLFRNWTDQFISNLYDTRLVDCKYAGIIEDSIMLNQYAEKLTDKNVLRYRIGELDLAPLDTSVHIPTSGTRNFHTGTTQENVEKIAMQGMTPVQIAEKIVKKDMTPPSQIDTLYLQSWRAAFPQKVHIGDHVYMIYMKISGKDYINYAICSAQNHRVVWDNLFNFKVPISKITLKD
jgi:hypothetical protein